MASTNMGLTPPWGGAHGFDRGASARHQGVPMRPASAIPMAPDSPAPPTPREAMSLSVPSRSSLPSRQGGWMGHQRRHLQPTVTNQPYQDGSTHPPSPLPLTPRSRRFSPHPHLQYGGTAYENVPQSPVGRPSDNVGGAIPPVARPVELTVVASPLLAGGSGLLSPGLPQAGGSSLGLSPGLPPTLNFESFFDPNSNRTAASMAATQSAASARASVTAQPVYHSTSTSVPHARSKVSGAGGRRHGRRSGRRTITDLSTQRATSKASPFWGYSLQQAGLLIALAMCIACVPTFIGFKKHAAASPWQGGAGGGSTVKGVPNRPNIILFFPDDMGYNDVTYHNTDVQRPYTTTNIDKLAKAGVRMSTYYTAPTCSPARCALLTGRYMMRSGCQHEDFDNDVPSGVPLSEVFIPQYLKKAGYHTMMLGKWHLGMFTKSHLPTSRGFDEFVGFLGGGEDHFDHDDDDVYDFWSNTSVNTDAAGVFTTYVLNSTMQTFLSTQAAAKQPFFIYVPTQAPHGPYEAPSKWQSKLTYGFEEEGGEASCWAAMMLMLDDFVGSTVRGLQQNGLYDNTVVIFAGDHGAPSDEPDWNGNMGRDYPFRGEKSQLWEGGVRVPAFISAPFIPAAWQGKTYDGLTSVVDWLPTLAGLAGADVSEGNALDGLDLSQVIWGTKSMDTEREYLINVDQACAYDNNWDDPNAALRYGDYKMVADCVSSSGTFMGTTRLYDLSSDPTESYNLLEDSSFTQSKSSVISYMKERLAYYASVAAEPHQNDAPYQGNNYWCADCQKGCPASDGYMWPFYSAYSTTYIGDTTSCEREEDGDMDDDHEGDGGE